MNQEIRYECDNTEESADEQDPGMPKIHNGTIVYDAEFSRYQVYECSKYQSGDPIDRINERFI